MSGCAGREWFGSGGSAASLEGPRSPSAAGLVHRGGAAGRAAHPAATLGQRVRLTRVPMTWSGREHEVTLRRPTRTLRSVHLRSAPALPHHSARAHAPRAAPLTHTPPRAALAPAPRAALAHAHSSRSAPPLLPHRSATGGEVTPEYRMETAAQNPCSHHHASQTELCRLVDHTPAGVTPPTARRSPHRLALSAPRRPSPRRPSCRCDRPDSRSRDSSASSGRG